MSEKNMPLYWENHLKEKIARIHELQAKGGNGCVSVGFLSDVHWRTNLLGSVGALERVLNDCSIPYYFNGGDTVSGCGICPKEFLFEELTDYRRAYRAVEHKCLIVEGNHDRAYSTFEAPTYYAQNMSFAELYEYIFRPQSLYPDRVMSKDGRYYYVDDKSRKVRFIALNSQDVPNDKHDEEGKVIYSSMLNFGFLQEQLDWLVNIALDVPDKEWSVVLCSHACPIYGGDVWDKEKHYNYPLALGILNAFRKHEKFQGETNFPDPLFNAKVDCDFTGKGGNVIVWLGGHTHRDRLKEVEGIVCMEIDTDSMQSAGRSEYDRVERSYRTNAIDILTIYPDQKKVYVTRVGAGPDREFTYETFE